MKTDMAIGWSLPSTYQQTGVHHGYRTAEHRGDPPFTGVMKAWYGRLEPGGFIVPHIDASPWFRRWHHPITPGGFVWVDGVMLAPTEPFEVHHWEPHAVWVPPDQDAREHLIVEYAEQIPGESGLVLCDMIEPVAELLERVT